MRFIDIGATGRSSLEFARDLLASCDTAVVPGITFGPSCDRYVRVAFTIADEELREGLQRLRAHIEKLQRQSMIDRGKDLHDRVNGERLLSDLRELASIRPVQDRRRSGGAVAADLEARRWLMRRMQEAGLEPHMDEVANVYGRDPDARRAAPDRLAYRYGSAWADGSTGRSASSMRSRSPARRKESGESSPIGIDVMSFQDEEGTYLAFLGSRTFCNDLTPAEIEPPRSAARCSCARRWRACHPAAVPLRIDPARHLCYLEAHIEQGPRLEQARPAHRCRHRDSRDQAIPHPHPRPGRSCRHDADGHPQRMRARRCCALLRG